MDEVLLIQINGSPYGILKRQIAGPFELASEHWLSDTTGPAVGLTVVGDRTVTLFDLGGRIGLQQTFNPMEPLYYFSASAGEDIAFVFPGPVESDWLASDAVLPVPGIVRTALIHSCGVLSSRPIPLIDVDRLYARVLTSVFEAPEPGKASPVRPNHSGDSEAPIHLLEIDEEPFAAALEDMQTAVARPEQFAALPRLPSGISGLVLHEDEILTLVSPAGASIASRSGKSTQMVVGRIGDQRLGLPVDRVIDTFEPGALPIHPLPSLARSDGFLSAVLWNEDIFPLIELCEVLGRNSNEDRLDSCTCKTDSVRKERPYSDGRDLDIIELDFGGFRCALPASDVKYTFPAKSYRKLRASKPAVAGVAEYQGVLWPVVDPAVCFGSTPGKAAPRMVRYESEDLRALVLAGDKTVERRLPAEMQHALPFHQHHGMVHCCYPDDGTVRLVLNMPALAEHFDGSCALQITDPEGVVQTDVAAGSIVELPFENDDGEAGWKRFECAERQRRKPVIPLSGAKRTGSSDVGKKTADQRMEEAAPAIRSDWDAVSPGKTDETGREDLQPIGRAPTPEPTDPVVASLKRVSNRSLSVESTGAPEARDTQAVPATDSSPEPNDPRDKSGEVCQTDGNSGRSLPEEALTEADYRHLEASSEPEPPDDVFPVLDTDDKWRTTDPADIDDVASDDEESIVLTGTDLEDFSPRSIDPSPLSINRIRPLDSVGDLLLRRADQSKAVEMHSSLADVPLPELSAAEGPGLIRRWGPVAKISGVTLAVLFLGAVVFYWHSPSRQPAGTPSTRKVVTVPIAYEPSGDAETNTTVLGSNSPAAGISETGFADTFWSDIRNTRHETAVSSVAETTPEYPGVFEKARPWESSPESGIITVVTSPPAKALPPDSVPGSESRGVTHHVNKGDTLWEISEHYTGSAWNFPKLARDNAIRDPDTIFPNQTIVIHDP